MAETTLTPVAHSCVLLDFDGHRILTDPWFSEKPGYHQGERRAYASAADLPPLAGVLISHGHYDHFDLAAFAAYPARQGRSATACCSRWTAGPGGTRTPSPISLRTRRSRCSTRPPPAPIGN